MSSGEEQLLDIPKTDEPFKKRFKRQVSAADLCKVVIANHSEEETTSEEDGSDESSEDDASDFGSSSEGSGCSEEDPGTDWTEQPVPTPVRVAYCDAQVLRVPPIGTHPRDYFNLLMNKSMYSLIIKNTNQYASCRGGFTPRHSWKPIKEDEMKRFLGLLFLMSLVKLPDLKLYWSSDKLFNFPTFRQIMSQERFLAILHNLRFCDDSVSDVADPLRKVRPLIEFFNILMESIYTPQKELIMNNPIKLAESSWERLFQVFLLSEPCGTVHKYLIYKQGLGEGAAERQRRFIIARDLMEGKLGKGHSVYLSGYFSSLSLMHFLRSENTNSTALFSQGSLKLNGTQIGGPDKFNQSFSPDGLCLIKWKDKGKDVVCVSSEFDGVLAQPVGRSRRSPQPLALVEHKRHLVNNHEKDVTTYPVGKKKLKWYRKVGLQIINIIMINSYYLYKRYSTNNETTFFRFKLDLIRTLLYSSSDPTSAGIALEKGVPYPKPHVLDYVGRNDKGFRKRKRCKYCITERGVRVDSYYHCISCENQPGFCLGQCFIKYHKYDNFM